MLGGGGPDNLFRPITSHEFSNQAALSAAQTNTALPRSHNCSAPRRFPAVLPPPSLPPLQTFLPQLGADQTLEGPPGRILNISSVQGKLGAPFMSAYCAARHGVEGLSECMRREVHGFTGKP